MARGWTGGQFSILRAALALTALVQISRDARGPAVTVAAVVVCLALACGLATRATGLLAAAGLVGASVVVGAGSIGLAALLVLVTQLAPPAPYGSLAARGRADPAGPWLMPASVPAIGTATLMAGTAFAGTLAGHADGDPRGAALAAGAWIAVALIAVNRTRALGWLLAGVTILAAGDDGAGFAVLQPMLVGAWLIAVEPGWLPPVAPAGSARLFYDGTCGLCHGAVRFLLAEESPVRPGAALRFAPLHGPSFESCVPRDRRDRLPDSLVLIDGDGTLTTRSAAVIRVGRRLGGLWRALVAVLALLPRPLAHAGYDLIAASRRSIFPVPDDVCPLIPPRLGSRFDD